MASDHKVTEDDRTGIRYRSLIAASSQIVWTADSDGRLSGEQHSWRVYTGQGAAELENDGWMNAIHPDDRSEFQTGFNCAVQSGFIFETECRIRKYDGQYRDFEVRGVPVLDIPQEYYQSPDFTVQGVPVTEADCRILEWVGTCSDITTRKSAEREMRFYAERLRILRELDQDILAARSTKAIAEFALLRLATLVPSCRSSVTLFDHVTRQATILAQRGNGSTNLHAGSVVPFSLDGLRKELALGATAETPDMMAKLDRTWVEEELIREGVRSSICFPLLYGGVLIGSLNLGQSEPGLFPKDQTEIVRDVGDVLTLAIQQARLHEQSQLQAEWLERRVQSRTRQLEESNAELDAFAYSVSHDLRAPLRNIQGFAQAVVQDCQSKLGAEQLEYLRRIDHSAGRMDHLIQGLLEYSRISREKLNIGPVSLNEIVSRAIEGLASERIVVERPLPVVLGQPWALTRVVANLLSNAVKFAAPDRPAEVTIRADRSGSTCRLWVQDNGVGIESAHQGRIFDIFVRLHSEGSYEGTGVGLSIVRKTMERLGGACGVESVPGQGSRFWIELPTP